MAKRQPLAYWCMHGQSIAQMARLDPHNQALLQLMNLLPEDWHDWTLVCLMRHLEEAKLLHTMEVDCVHSLQNLCWQVLSSLAQGFPFERSAVVVVVNS